MEHGLQWATRFTSGSIGIAVRMLNLRWPQYLNGKSDIIAAFDSRTTTTTRHLGPVSVNQQRSARVHSQLTNIDRGCELLQSVD